MIGRRCFQDERGLLEIPSGFHLIGCSGRFAFVSVKGYLVAMLARSLPAQDRFGGFVSHDSKVFDHVSLESLASARERLSASPDTRKYQVAID